MRLMVCAALVGASVMAAAPIAASLTPATEPIGPWRRAYRAECVKFQPADYCECVTAGFAQDLTPDELTLARLRLPIVNASSPQRASAARARLMRAAPGLGFADERSRSAAVSKIESLENELQTSCGAP